MENKTIEIPENWVVIVVISVILLCILSDIALPSSSTPTPEPNYKGSCYHWTEASKLAGKSTCIWGFPTSTASGSWVWLHFSERSYPFPDFAVDIDEYNGSDLKFTANNIKAKYVGHCVEVYGKLVIESNTYNNKTVDQPVIHVSSSSDLKYCDNKFSN
jgi:hypothetical protein